MTERPDLPPRWPLLSLLLRVAVFVGVIVLLHFGIGWAMRMAEASNKSDMLTIGLLSCFIVGYALLIAVPFVPGIEIGLSLLALRGAEVAPALYIATLAGLMLAFLAGRHLPLGGLAGRLRDLRLSRAAELLTELEALGPEERVARLRAHLPPRLAPRLVRWRYVWLALLVNMPGNGLIGGGGGVCLVAGLSGIFSPRPVAVTLAIAVAPVPLLVWWAGIDPTAYFSFL